MWLIKYTYRRIKATSELRTFRTMNANAKPPDWVCLAVKKAAGQQNGTYAVYNPSQVRREQ